jgi:hypothetical protein
MFGPSRGALVLRALRHRRSQGAQCLRCATHHQGEPYALDSPLGKLMVAEADEGFGAIQLQSSLHSLALPLGKARLVARFRPA